MNGIYELPLGPGKRLLGKTNRVVGNIIGGWQIGGIAQILSGQPLNLTAINAVNLVFAAGAVPTTPGVATPVVLGAFPSNTGSVTRVGNGVVFFPGLQVVPDKSVATKGSRSESCRI